MRSRLDWRYRPGIGVFLALALLLTFSVRRLHRFSPIPRRQPSAFVSLIHLPIHLPMASHNAAPSTMT